MGVSWTLLDSTYIYDIYDNNDGVPMKVMTQVRYGVLNI